MAKKKDYIPTRDDALLTYHDNLKTQIAALVGQAGITAADVTAVNNDNATLHTAIGDVASADAVKQAKVATKKTNVGTVVGNTRALANRVKAAVGYTAAIGQQLGFIGEEDTTDLSTSNPTPRPAGAPVAGSVQIDFNKSISDGVQVFSKRGSETSFTLLAFDTEPPYVDTRPNLAPGPETRQYQVRYVLNDQAIGNMSPILTVTVPG
jgi:hypothetical protein